MTPKPNMISCQDLEREFFKNINNYELRYQDRSSTPLPPKEFDRAISKPKIDYERKAREYLQAMLSKPRHHGYRPKKARRGDYPEMEFNDIEVPPTVSVIMARLKAERQIKQLYSHVFYGPISNEGKVRCN